MCVVTPRCAAAAVVSAMVLRRPTKEYTHRYSMMHRRLTTAGIEVAPHYHQLLVLIAILQVLVFLICGLRLLVRVVAVRKWSANVQSRVGLILCTPTFFDQFQPHSTNRHKVEVLKNVVFC